MKYKVVRAYSIYGLSDDVELLSAIGYKPQGGVSMIYEENVRKYVYAQAMVKE